MSCEPIAVLGAVGDTQKHENWGLPQIVHCLFEETRLGHIKCSFSPQADTCLPGSYSGEHIIKFQSVGEILLET